MPSQDRSHEVTVILPAGGAGLRFGGGRSKLLEEISGKPVIQHTVDRIKEVTGVRRILIPCPQDARAAFEKILASYTGIILLDGGSTRQESVRKALEAAEAEGVQDDDIIAVHDAARCCVSPVLFQEALDAAGILGAVSAGVPLTDSIKKVDEEGRVLASPDRDKLWIVQTPQVFKFRILREAHRNLGANATDDASLVESMVPVFMVRGEYTNIKITTRSDLEVAAVIIKKGLNNE